MGLLLAVEMRLLRHWSRGTVAAENFNVVRCDDSIFVCCVVGV